MWGCPASVLFILLSWRRPSLTGLLSPSACLPRVSPNQSAKVCPFKGQGPYFSEDQNLSAHYHNAQDGLQLSPTRLSLFKDCLLGTSPSCPTYQLCQEVILQALQEAPKVFPLCCTLFPADISSHKLKSPMVRLLLIAYGIFHLHISF